MNRSQTQINKISIFVEKIVLATAGIGMFLSTLDTGIINVALPFLEQEFHTNFTSITWAATLYLTALSVTIVIFGRLSDRYGVIKIYTLGLLVFAVASVLCGFSHSVGTLLLFRTMQGIGAAMLQSTAAALVTTLVVPERRGAALGTLNVMIGLGPILGPTAGGFLISTGGWRWIFWINIPFCIAGLWGCRKLSTNITVKPKETIPIDVLGNILLAVGLLAFLQGLSMWSTVGIRSPYTFVPLIFFVFVFILFLICEQRASYPIINLHLFSNGSFTASFLATIGFGAASAIVFIVPPYFLEKVAHLATWKVGLICLSSPLGFVIMSHISGKLIKRLGTNRLMIVGLLTMLVALIGLTTIKRNYNLPILFFLLLMYGVGGGLFQPSNMAVIMGSVTRKLQGTIGAVQRMTQNVSIAFGTSVSATLIQSHTSMGADGLILAFREAWIFSALLILLNLFSFIFWRNSTHI
jgi:EmrB/QacA subfamily drug resistance transporter